MAFFCLHTFTAFADTSAPTTNWYEGVVVLADSSVFKGEVSYNHQYDQLMLREEQIVRTLSARQLISFHYLDFE